MTIEKECVTPTTVGKLLAASLKIPPYQRLYSWRPATALQLLDDIRDAKCQTRNVPYILGAVILHEEENYCNVVDGQQRLITLRMLLDLLEHPGSHTDITAPNHESSKDMPPIVRVLRALRREINSEQTGDNEALATFIKEKCHLICIVTNDIDEAFRVFDSQNYRGKPLAPHDLLKAYHLRVMRKETEDTKTQDKDTEVRRLVEAWESAGDAALDRLFSLYLYRIARWSRGEHAPGFTAQDIGLFKGILPDKDSTPYTHYHIAAQTEEPQDSAATDEESRAMEHARFQLDAPLVAGRLFFERVTFMLTDLKRLTENTIEYGKQYEKEFPFYRISTDGTIEHPPSRYRYVSDLYLAAALYYTNKFGEKNFEQMRDSLFAWAYALRIKQLRVQYQSVDNLAAIDNDPNVSAFKRIRNAVYPSEFRGLPVSISTPNGSADHEKQLVTFLKSKGFEINEQV